MKVALGAARGLAFLHSAEAKVIYRDFKTSNILLDSVCIWIASSIISLLFFLIFFIVLVPWLKLVRFKLLSDS